MTNPKSTSKRDITLFRLSIITSVNTGPLRKVVIKKVISDFSEPKCQQHTALENYQNGGQRCVAFMLEHTKGRS